MPTSVPGVISDFNVLHAPRVNSNDKSPVLFSVQPSTFEICFAVGMKIFNHKVYGD